MTPVFRFAPSPNGALHLGHALSALLNAEAARKANGVLRLRIDDVDETRARKEHEAGILEDLAWLGVSWRSPLVRQSTRGALYQAALARLQALGVVYPAFASRREVGELCAAEGESWPRDPDGAPLYPRIDRRRSAEERAALKAQGAAFSLRLDMKKAQALAPEALFWQEAERPEGAKPHTVAANPAAWGDVLLKGRDAPASYHLAVVVDDLEDGVTHVIRGRDLFAATGVHRLLQALLGITPPVYHHHRLVLDAAGKKLSKSASSEALRARRMAGATPQDIRALLAL